MNLSASGLRRVYRTGDVTTEAISGVDVTIESGEFVAIVGASGSGKTTLLNTLSSLDTQFKGTVELGEHSLGELSESKLARLRQREIGFVFQAFNLLDHLTALENVTLPGFFGPLDNTDPRQRGLELLGRVGLGDRAESRPPQLSGGQKQRVAIARALFCEPSIIFCDEPTGSLDQSTGLSIMHLFDEINRDAGMTLVVVTHEPYIADMARRRIVIEDGTILEDKTQTPRWPSEDDPQDTSTPLNDETSDQESTEAAS